MEQERVTRTPRRTDTTGSRATDDGRVPRPGPVRRLRSRSLALTGAALTLAFMAPPGVAHADPDPSVKELTEQATKLADQLEQLTEQFNGLRVRYEQSKRASKVAAANADRQEAALEVMRRKVGSLAATSYMQGGVDPSVGMVTTEDPRALLDKSATLRYFAARDSSKVQDMLQTMQAAQRARKAADARAAQVTELRADIDAKRDKVGDLYEKVRGRVIKKDPSAMVRLPVVGTGKAAQALRFAMTKLGKPYVWGAEGPNSFDCSGLTMWAYRQVGISLPHYTGSQWNAGTHVPRDQLQPGDLVFFHSDLHHMGMYVGNGQMLHAPQTGDVVRIAPLAGRPYAGAVRVA